MDSPTGFHPPTQPFIPPPPVPLSRWPMVIGLILLIYGGLFAVCGAAGQLFERLVPRSMRSQVTAPSAGWWADYMLASKVVSEIMFISVAIVGIGLLMRRRWSIWFAQAWSVLEILITLVSLGISFAVREELLRMAQSNVPASISPQFMQQIMVASVCLSTLLTLGLPVFLLVWFKRGAIKAEVSQWA